MARNWSKKSADDFVFRYDPQLIRFWIVPNQISLASLALKKSYRTGPGQKAIRHKFVMSNFRNRELSTMISMMPSPKLSINKAFGSRHRKDTSAPPTCASA
jgi:hypothetical protein